MFGAVGLVTFVHCVAWNNPVFLDQILNHMPLSSVRNRLFQQFAYVWVVGGFVVQCPDGVQEPVAFFKLVPKIEIRLTEFKFRIEFVPMHHMGTQDIQETEQPTSAAGLLVTGGGGNVQFVRKGRVQGIDSVGVDQYFGQRGVGQGVASNVLSGIGRGGVMVVEFLEKGRGDVKRGGRRSGCAHWTNRVDKRNKKGRFNTRD